MPEDRPLHRNRDYLLLWSGQVASALGCTGPHRATGATVSANT